MSLSTDQKRRDDYAKFVIDEYLHNTLEVTASTRVCYASIIGRIWQRHPPASKDTKTERHLVGCGVDVNDLWLVAAAWEHGLIVLTEDAMSWIREAVGRDVVFDCWI
jgi:predicted nucleic acid-binding protein